MTKSSKILDPIVELKEGDVVAIVKNTKKADPEDPKFNHIVVFATPANKIKIGAGKSHPIEVTDWLRSKINKNDLMLVESGGYYLYEQFHTKG